jgi:hypothetical protein
MLFGAVYKPLPEINPTGGSTLHETTPEIDVENCWLSEEPSATALGDIFPVCGWGEPDTSEGRPLITLTVYLGGSARLAVATVNGTDKDFPGGSPPNAARYPPVLEKHFVMTELPNRACPGAKSKTKYSEGMEALDSLVNVYEPEYKLEKAG